MKVNTISFVMTTIITFAIMNSIQSLKKEREELIQEQTPDIKEDTTGSQQIQDFADEEIANYKQASCEGECFEVPMNLPPNEYWSTDIPVDGWTSSHGTPSVGPNKIWMWSYNNYGEGANLQHSFTSGNDYCLETVLTTKVRDNATANPNATFNIILTPNRVQNPVLTQFQIPSTPSPNQSIFNASFASYLPSGSAIHVMNFTANNNFNNVWFHPSSPTLPVVEAAIRKVRICKKQRFCDQIKLDFNFKQGLCSVINFYSYVGFPAGGAIIGYIWNFGDGTYSYDANPVHDYGSANVWYGTLTVHIRYREQCCTKTIKFKVKTDECDPCKKLNYLYVTQNVSSGMVTFTPSIAHNPYYLYRWYFSDGTQYNTYEVTKPVGSIFWGYVVIYYVEPFDQSGRCCQRARWFRYRPKKEIMNIDHLADVISEEL